MIHPESESYIVENTKDEGWKRDWYLGIFILVAVMALVGLMNGTGEFISNVLNVAILAICVVLTIMMYVPRKKMKIQVSGDCFTVIEAENGGQEYQFSEITKVSMHRPVYRTVHAWHSGPNCWRIEVEGRCVAVFTDEMENSSRLIGRLDELGLITKYATGNRT